MGKKKACERDGAAPRTTADASTSMMQGSSPVAPSAPAPSTAGEAALLGNGWIRVRRSVIALLILVAVAMLVDPAWRECLTIAAPDHAPLLGVAAIFAVSVCRRWASTGRRGLHPVYRLLGFLLIMLMGASFLPFNATVTMYEVPLLTEDECQTVVNAVEAAVALPDFVPTRYRFDPATEVPLTDISSEVSSLVEDAMHGMLLPFLRLQYLTEGVVVLGGGGMYVEHYPAYHQHLPVPHIRAGELTVRVELTPPEEHGVGGVRLDTMGKSVQPEMGTALVLPAKLRHGTDGIGSGTRSVLVGTLSVKPRTPWQRLVSMWRLWGLFSRRVRYIADRGLVAHGEPVEEEVVLEERGLDADGKDPLEF